MRVVVVGSAGQLGRALVDSAPPGQTVLGFDRNRVDVADPAAVAALLRDCEPDVVINAAAYTAVDRAESEPDAAFAVNAAGAGAVAESTVRRGARLIHVSTDFVFDGTKSSPYLPHDPPNPLGVYGRSKLEGEARVRDASAGEALIVRTAWLYSPCGSNFLRTMLALMAARRELRVVADQVGTPTAARSLAAAIWRAVADPALRGTHHFTDAGVASWYDFAVAIQEEALAAGLLREAVPVRPIGTGEFPTAARRPPYSVLDKAATWGALGWTPQHWRVELRSTLSRMANA